MFVYDLAHWSIFMSASILLVLAPGPDHIYVLSSALSQGKRAGFAALIGILLGLLTHMIAVAAGLAALIANAPSVMVALKFCGGLYLVYLGYKSFKAASNGIALHSSPQGQSERAILLNGYMVNILNPKIFIFFLAFLPQFVEPNAGPEWLQVLLHGSILILMGSSFQWALVVASGSFSRFITRHPAILTWINRIFGLILIGFGAKLILLG